MKTARRTLMIAVLLSSGAIPACAADPLASGAPIETVVVSGDKTALINTRDSNSAFGLALSPQVTPRAIATISDTTLSRYGISGIDDLSAVVPNAYTASYYGVEGAVNLRGTLAENYFRGFKRVENRGTYETPISDAAKLEVVSGPPSPVYGPGKVGGVVNFIPKTAIKDGSYIDEVIGNVALTYGAYEKRNINGQIGVPVQIGDVRGGLYAYGEIDDSHSYYRNIHPSHQLAELSGDIALGAGWQVSADYMYYHSNGNVQTAGWNRLTQDLIDNQTYITGRDTSLTDTNGDGRISFDEMGGNPYTGTGNYNPLYISYGSTTTTDAQHTLDTNVGTTKLSRRTVYVDKGVDFSNTFTHTGYLGLSHIADNGNTLKIEAFTDMLSNTRFSSYGYPADYHSHVYEGRASYSINADALSGALTSETIAGLSYRYVHAIMRESYNSGAIALDRRDLSAGASADDIIDSPFNTDAAGVIGMGWENDIHSASRDMGAFITSHIAWQDRLHLILGGRYDHFSAGAKDHGVLPYEVTSGADHKGVFSYSASLSYATGIGINPYITYAKAHAPELNQAGGITPSLLSEATWLSASYLSEGGLKFDFLSSHLVGALTYYRQQRTKLERGSDGDVRIGTIAKGFEAELRYVINDNYSLTMSGDMQHTQITGDTSFAYIPARLMGVSGEDGFGGTYVVWDKSTLSGWSENYSDTLIPHMSLSAYGSYTTDPHPWGEAGLTFGGTYVSRTRQDIPDPLIFHPYMVLNMSAYVKRGDWKLALNINNLTDKLYFTPDADSYANLGALPSKGRMWRLKLESAF